MPSEEEIDLAVFAQLSAEVQAGYATGGADAWKASPFRWIKSEPSRRVGAIGEKLIEAWVLHEGIAVRAPVNTGHDRILNGVKIEVKFSTLWVGGGFTFQQIRDQDYDVAALLGLEPQKTHLWFVPKAVLFEHAVGQHTGAAARDTMWIRFNADSRPLWLGQYGGPLSTARAALKEASRGLGRG